MKRIIILISLVFLTTASFAQANYPTRIKDERVKIYEKWREKVLVFASPDHDNPGEILVYYFVNNSPRDSVFIVLDKKGCEEMLQSLDVSRKKLDEWHKISKKNHAHNISKDVDLYFPPVDVFWKLLGPRIGEHTFYPFYLRSGKDYRLKPRLTILDEGAVYIDFTFSVPDDVGKPYEIKFSLNRPRIKEYPMYFDYEAIKKVYVEKTRSQEGIEDLFN